MVNVVACYVLGDVLTKKLLNKYQTIHILLVRLLLECPINPGEGLGEGPIGDEGYPFDISSILPGG